MNQMKATLSTAGRIAGVLMLAGFLLAACGDDDDDDLGAGEDTSPTVPAVDVTETEPMTEDSTATEADAESTAADDASPTGEGTESEPDTTSTEDGAAMTGTPDDDMATETETDSAGSTPTEDNMTPTPDMGNETPTESDGGMTPTEADDGTATADDATGTADDATETADDATGTADGADGDSAELGSEIEGDGFTIVVEGIESFAGIPGALEPDTGRQFVAVTVTIENTNSDPLPLLRTLSSIHMETGDGERYDLDLIASAALLVNQQGMMDTQLEAGDEITGSVGFQVPEAPEGLTLVIEVDSDGETVEIDISDEL